MGGRHYGDENGSDGDGNDVVTVMKDWDGSDGTGFLQRVGRSAALGLVKKRWASAIGVSWALSQLGRPSCIPGRAGRIDPF